MSYNTCRRSYADNLWLLLPDFLVIGQAIVITPPTWVLWMPPGQEWHQHQSRFSIRYYPTVTIILLLSPLYSADFRSEEWWQTRAVATCRHSIPHHQYAADVAAARPWPSCFNVRRVNHIALAELGYRQQH